MPGKLTQKELERIVEKLRGQYEENQKIYGPVYFNLKGFNDRYLQALRNRIDLQTFVAAEVTALEELKKKVEKKVRERKIRTEKSFTKKIEKMIDDMAEKTRKYPAFFEESGLPEEFQRLCGGLQVFHDREWLMLGRLIEKNDLKNSREHLEISEKIEKYFVHSRGSLSYVAEQFLSTERRDGYDKAHISILREAAVLLGDALTFLNGLKFIDPAEIIDLRPVSGVLAPFNGRTRSEILQLIRKSLTDLTADFRLTDLSQ